MSPRARVLVPVNLVDSTGLSVLGDLGIDLDVVQVFTGIRIGLSVTLVIGDPNTVIVVATGYDIIWGEHLSDDERASYAEVPGLAR